MWPPSAADTIFLRLYVQEPNFTGLYSWPWQLIARGAENAKRENARHEIAGYEIAGHKNRSKYGSS